MLVYIVALLFSFPPILIMNLIQVIPVNYILLFRFVFVAITYPYIIKIIKKVSLKELYSITKNELKYIFLLSLMLMSNMFLFFQSLYYIDVSTASFLFLTFPIFTLILARILLKEQISLVDIIVAVISFIGLLFMFSNQLELQSYKGQLMALASAILFSFYVIINRKSSQSINHYKKTNWLFIFNSLILLAVIPFFSQEIEFTSLTNLNISLLLLLATLFTLIPFTLQLYAIKYVKSSTFSMILLLGPTLTIFWSFLILKESLSLNIIFGGLLILIAAFFSTYSVEKIFYASKEFSRKIKSFLFEY